MTLSRDQFKPVEFSRSGKPKKRYATKAEADAVAALHAEKYGTVAESYLGRDRGWYVTTNRRETASNRAGDKLREKARMQEPLVASNISTRQQVHTGTGISLTMKLAGMNPASPHHDQYLDWVGRANQGR